MAAITSIVRDAVALSDPEPERRLGGAEQFGPEAIRSYQLVGRMLLTSAARTGSVQATAAAVEVFRNAAENVPKDPSLRNALGGALIERARLESSTVALATLKEAMQAFQAALVLARRQASPRVASLRYEINLGMVLWMLGERTTDIKQVNKAVGILKSALTELPKSSAHRPHVQDNYGNALMALGKTQEAIGAYRAALDGQQTAADRGRTLNNLGTAYAEQKHFAEAYRCYGEALTLQLKDQMPLRWARTQHNLASALLQETLDGSPSEHVGKQLHRAIQAFKAALRHRQRQISPMDWAMTTTNMASAYLALGTHLCTQKIQGNHQNGVSHIRQAIRLYEESLSELMPPDAAASVKNIGIAKEVIERVSSSTEAAATRKVALAAERPPRQERSADPPWPTEIYSEAHRVRKENIVEFLMRVWLPLIRAGLVDLPTLRSKDPSAAKAIENFTRQVDPLTGERRSLPPDLHIPTKKEVTDRLAASIAHPGDRPVRLDWALRARARRGLRK